MKSAAPLLPDLDNLRAGLTSALNGSGLGHGQVVVLNREPAVWVSTYPAEIITCRLANGKEQKLFCKYMAGLRYESYGHRGGVPYEAAVYRDVLRPLRLSMPEFCGAHEDGKTGETWLFIQYLEQSMRVGKAPQPGAILCAARWIAQFHAANETRVPSTATSFLHRYDGEYYAGWVRRTSRFAGHWHEQFPWLTTLCEQSEKFISVLLAAQQTVIHGEFYPRNVLFSDGVVYPVDWESAAVGPGEVDLATLTEAWGEEIEGKIEREYQQTRWPQGPPADFSRRLTAARLYVAFRWAGEHPDLTVRKGYRVYFEQLRSYGKELGLL